MTQTVPDISPLMPMHQDPLLVLYILHNWKFEWQHWSDGVSIYPYIVNVINNVAHNIRMVSAVPAGHYMPGARITMTS